MSIEIHEAEGCCGLHEISNIAEYTDMPELVIEELCKTFNEYEGDQAFRGAFMYFTGVVKEKYGQQLASYIRKNRLGTIVQTPAATNLRSGNKIKVWIWVHDRKRLRTWAAKRNIRDF